MSATRMLDIAKFLDVDDNTLALLFGQYIAKNICEKPIGAPGAPDTLPLCSLHGVQRHWAIDEWNRPSPLHDANDHLDALEAAVAHFAGGWLEITTTHEPPQHWHVAVRLQEGEVSTTAYVTGDYTDTDYRGRWYHIRRATIICLLALADAPATIRTVDEIQTVVEQEIRELRTIATHAPEAL